jgi:hypothetical protein
VNALHQIKKLKPYNNNHLSHRKIGRLSDIRPTGLRHDQPSNRYTRPSTQYRYYLPALSARYFSPNSLPGRSYYANCQCDHMVMKTRC